MILNSTKEIQNILLRYLPLDIIIKIMNIRDKIIERETKIYWRTITPKYNFIFFGFMGTDHNKLAQNALIKRINGSFEKLKEEMDELRYLKLQNEEWAEAWNRVRF